MISGRQRIAQIAGMRYAFFGEPAVLSGFLATGGNEAQRRILLIDTPFKRECALASYQHDQLTVYRLPNGEWLYEAPTGMPVTQVRLFKEGGGLEVFAPPWPDPAKGEMKLMHLIRTALECHFCTEGILSLHAACVEKGGYAVAFTGESGIGKSTRAQAWVKNLGATWISGDRPAVRLGKNIAVACGVPWDGKEQIFNNVEHPLLAVLEVRRSARTYLRRLSSAQARRLMMRQCFVPMWDTDAAALAMANVQTLLRLVPVYRLFCGPDRKGALKSYGDLYHHPEKILEEAREMKIKEGFVLRMVMGEAIVMPTGDNIARFDGAVVLNRVSAFIVENLQQSTSREDLLIALLDEFDVDRETASKDLDGLLEKLQSLNMLDME